MKIKINYNIIYNSKQIGGSDYAFRPGERFKYRGQTGTVIKIAAIDEFGGDFYFDSKNYVVRFDGFGKHTATFNFGSDRYVMAENDMEKMTSSLDDWDSLFKPSNKSESFEPFVKSESFEPFVKSESLESSKKKCKFKIGSKVSVSGENLKFKNPFRDEYVKFKAGKITDIYPLSEYTIPPYKCLYEITFNDDTIAVEVAEELIRESISREMSTDTDSSSRSIGTSTDSDSSAKSIGTSTFDFFKPSSNSSNSSRDATDILSLIALNAINENIRDSKKQRDNQYNPYLESPYKYDVEDIGDNEDLKEDVTDFFYNKTLKWLDKDIEFAKVKKTKKILKTKKGKTYIYKILSSFVKKNRVNWYELRSEKNFEDVKDYIRLKLGSL